MYLKEFINKMGTTKDTVRFYLELKLLTPKRKGKNYWFTEQETAAFEEIKKLQELGFSLQEICTVKLRHDQACGTELQWRQNLDLVRTKLQENEAIINQLERRNIGLKQLEAALKQKLLIR